jgi:hypothetical protein
MNKIISKFKIFVVMTLCTVGTAVAGIIVDPPTQVPEPSILGLIAAAGVAFIILKKGKKK